MKNKFTIGEISKMHNISVQTLRYYDKINLFKPNYIDDTNGYRYYTAQQFERLNTIIYMKFLGLSLHEIQLSLDNYEVANARQLLLQQKEAVDGKIEQLKSIRKRLDDKLNCLNIGMTIDKSFATMGIKTIGERSCALLEFDRPTDALDMIFSGRELDDTLVSNMTGFFSLFCVILPCDNLLKDQFKLFTGIGFIGNYSDFKPETVKTIPAGEYAFIFHRGPYDNTGQSYKKLLNYIKVHAYNISGDALEINLIDSSLTSKEHEFITELQIPVKKA